MYQHFPYYYDLWWHFTFFNCISTFLYYVSCVFQFFTKYSLFFKLSKYDFWKPRVEFVSHNCTAQWYKIEFFRQLVHYWYPLSTFVHSSTFIVLSLKHKSNICGDHIVLIIIQVFLSWLGHHPMVFYLIHSNRTYFFPFTSLLWLFQTKFV